MKMQFIHIKQYEKMVISSVSLNKKTSNIKNKYHYVFMSTKNNDIALYDFYIFFRVK